MAEVGAAVVAADLGAHHPCDRSDRSSIAASFTGVEKLGQPVPDSNFVSDEKSGSPQHTHAYVPSSWQSQYSPVKARSVPACRVDFVLLGREALAPLGLAGRELVAGDSVHLFLLFPAVDTARHESVPGRSHPAGHVVARRPDLR